MLRGCLLLPFKLIPWLIRQIINGVKWCINAGTKGWIILGVVGFIVLIMLLGQCSYCMNPAPPTLPTKTIDEPTKIEAPYYLAVGKDMYYMEKFHWQGSVLIIENYWKLEGNKWISSEGRAKALSGSKLKPYKR